MKIIQIAVTSDTDHCYPKLIVLTNEGELYVTILTEGVTSQMQKESPKWKLISGPKPE